MKSVSLGYSPCPNDTFIFYALIHGKVDTKGLRFDEVLLDVETLNQKALSSELDLTKISFHAFGHLRDKYCLLHSGSALGRGCGPLVIAKNACSMKDLRMKRIAIPGNLTTAYLLLQLYDPQFALKNSNIIEMPFHEIIAAVADEKADAGLIIHESRFTYPSYGLTAVMDLGKWWEEETGLPIPLGGIALKRTLIDGPGRDIDRFLKQSVEYAFANRSEPMAYIKNHSQELSEDVISRHIDLYVNDHSIDIGKEGKKAVEELISRAEDSGIIPRINRSLFM